MKRPLLVHFTCIETKENISIHASVTLSKRHGNGPFLSSQNADGDSLVPSSPWQALGLLSGTVFKLKIIGIDQGLKEVFNRTYESDSHGNFDLRISKHGHASAVARLTIFECGTHPGLDLLLGHFIPMQISDPKKIIICDFDKTLVDTKYSTTRELYQSLTKPLNHFPRVEKSISLYKKFIAEGYHPFILTASPHFYEEAIRDWLYQSGIYTAGIFLKDYRIVFSPLEGNLSPKDLKTQGFYKLDKLMSILLMTGIPDELILMGDGFESDTVIYLTLVTLLTEKVEPWSLWNIIKGQDSFKFTGQQNSRFLNKIYQLRTLLFQEWHPSPKIKIYIRVRPGRTAPQVHLALLRKNLALVEFYEA